MLFILGVNFFFLFVKTYLTLSISVGLCPKNPQPVSRGLEIKGNEIAAEVNLKFLDLKLQFKKNSILYKPLTLTRHLLQVFHFLSNLSFKCLCFHRGVALYFIDKVKIKFCFCFVSTREPPIGNFQSVYNAQLKHLPPLRSAGKHAGRNMLKNVSSLML